MKTIKILLMLICLGSITQAQVRLTNVNTSSGEVTITNMSGSVQDISSWWLCNFPGYEQLSALPVSGSTMLMDGESATFTSTIIVGADGECGLYNTNSFTSTAAMEDYMQWASAGHVRETVAVGAGVWCAGEFVDGSSTYLFTGGPADFCSAFWSGTSNVTFSVDMNSYGGSFGYVNVSGSFNGWCGDCSQMSDADMDGVWEITMPIADGDYDFKYSLDNWAVSEGLGIGAGWECTVQSGDFINRDLVVSGSDINIGTVCWDSCQPCAGAGIPGCMDASANNYNSMATEDDGSCLFNLTVSVNMNNYGGAFTTPEVNGVFNGWCGGCAQLADGDADGIWDLTFEIQEGWYEYKFAVDGWADQENLVGAGDCVVTNFGNTNRYVAINGHTTQPVVCWGECADCVANAGCTDSAAANYNAAATTDDGSCEYIISFAVDMNQYGASFTTAYVAGTFNGWCGNCNALADGDADGVWEGDIQIANGSHEFKFVLDNWTVQENFVGGESCTVSAGGFTNRSLTVSAPATYGPNCWNACDVCPSGSTDVTFSVDMSEQTVDAAGVHIGGSMQGWDPAGSPMTDMGGGIWEITFSIAPGTSVEYKYINGNAWGMDESVPSACGVDDGFGGNNRTWTVGASNESIPVHCYAECNVCGAGCMDSMATNYDSGATVDDGSCTYGPPTLTFDDAGSISPWTPVADATAPEASIMWNAAGNGTGAMELTGVNPDDGIGKAYIFEYSANSIDYSGATDYQLTFDVKTAGYSGAALHLQTNFPGVGIVNNFDLQAQGINDATWTSFSYDFSGIDNSSDLFYIHFNLAAGAFVGAGGTVLIDNIVLTPTVPDPVADFSVDMNNYGGAFTTVYVSGEFNGWCGDCNPLSDADMDGVWEGSVSMPAGTYDYKFTHDNWAGQENLVTGAGYPCTHQVGDFTNRFMTVPADGLSLGTVCWESCQACPAAGTPGCMDPMANNYNSMADEADGSCLYDVVFQVNMALYGGAYTAPEVNGVFNGWCGGCAPMADGDADNVWDITIELQEGWYEYKFAVDTWADQEDLVGAGACTVTNFGNTNRFVHVTGASTQPVVCWGSCEDCVAGAGCTDATATNYDSSATMDDGSCTYEVTFIVDMNQYGVAFTEANVNGTFNGWCGGCNPMTDGDADGVWETTIVLAAGDYEFKFTVDGWTDQEIFVGGESCTITTGGFTNRTLNVSGVTTYGVVCFNSCEACVSGAGCMDPLANNYDSMATSDDGSCEYDVIFTVDMNQYGTAGVDYFIPEVNGTFNGWCGGCNPLSDPEMDGVWSTTLSLAAGTYEYQFAVDGWADQEFGLDPAAPCTIGGNRLLEVTGPTDQGEVCWESCDACPISGCTDPAYVEFDPYADIDDGSCSVLVVMGCIYPEALNYDSNANTDNGSCTFDVDDCPADLNNDEVVNTEDLLEFLSAFGFVCP